MVQVNGRGSQYPWRPGARRQAWLMGEYGKDLPPARSLPCNQRSRRRCREGCVKLKALPWLQWSPLGLWRNTLPATWARATSLRFGIVASPCIHWSSEDAGTFSCLANSSRPIRPTTLRRSSCWCVSAKGAANLDHVVNDPGAQNARQAGAVRQARLRPIKGATGGAAGAWFAPQAACPLALKRKRSRFGFQLEDPEKDVGRWAALPRESTVEIVDAHGEGQSEVRVSRSSRSRSVMVRA
jgi:hypothetical protein